jgi:hypothetical protein
VSNGDIVVANADGSARVTLTRTPDALEAYPSWVDGATLLYFAFAPTPQSPPDAYRVKADGSNVIRIGSVDESVFAADLNP